MAQQEVIFMSRVFGALNSLQAALKDAVFVIIISSHIANPLEVLGGDGITGEQRP